MSLVRCLCLVLLAAAVAHAAGVNKFCLTLHCFSALSHCNSDNLCHKALQCLQACHSNDKACNNKCMDSYDDHAFDNFMKCAATDHGCIKIDHSHNVHCKTPTPVASYNIASLAGTFHTVKGQNSATDCYNCQVSVINHSGHTYTLHKSYDVTTVDGHVRQHVLTETITQPHAGQGKLHLTGMTEGLHHSEDWTVLAAGPNYVYVYYCGNTAGSIYDGAQVYAKTTSLTADEEAAISVAASANHFNYAHYCTPGVNSCHDFAGHVVG